MHQLKIAGQATMHARRTHPRYSPSDAKSVLKTMSDYVSSNTLMRSVSRRQRVYLSAGKNI